LSEASFDTIVAALKRGIDISVRVEEGIPVWPGDPEPEIRSLAQHGQDGHHLSRLTMTVHTGTHLDAPFHFLPEGKSLTEFPLAAFALRARVLEYFGEGPISSDWLGVQNLRNVEAVLFRTRNSDWWRQGDRSFHREFVALSGGAARMLVQNGVRLVGIDYLSVDPFDSSDFVAHKVLLGGNVLILETIRLDRTPAGEYGLICWPLSVASPDAAPARAVLIPQK